MIRIALDTPAYLSFFYSDGVYTMTMHFNCNVYIINDAVKLVETPEGMFQNSEQIDLGIIQMSPDQAMGLTLHKFMSGFWKANYKQTDNLFLH